eukprot:COSAG01_NODE_264_length_19971_cov_62.193923_12_plen_94_part_00
MSVCLLLLLLCLCARVAARMQLSLIRGKTLVSCMSVISDVRRLLSCLTFCMLAAMASSSSAAVGVSAARCHARYYASSSSSSLAAGSRQQGYS